MGYFLSILKPSAEMFSLRMHLHWVILQMVFHVTLKIWLWGYNQRMQFKWMKVLLFSDNEWTSVRLQERGKLGQSCHDTPSWCPWLLVPLIRQGPDNVRVDLHHWCHEKCHQRLRKPCSWAPAFRINTIQALVPRKVKWRGNASSAPLYPRLLFP